MKILKMALQILLVILLIIISMSFIIEKTTVSTFSQEIFSKKISGYFLDEIFYEFEDTEKLSEIETNIRKSKYINKISSKYIENTISNLVYNKNQKLDITEEVKQLVSKNIPKEFSTEKSDSTKQYLLENIVNSQERLEKSIEHGFGSYYLIILKLYSIFTSIYFRILMIGLCIVNILFLIKLEKLKFLKTFKISIIITMIASLIIFIGIKFSTNIIDQKLAGGWLSDINVNYIVISIIIEFIISLGLFIAERKYLKRST